MKLNECVYFYQKVRILGEAERKLEDQRPCM